MKGYYFVSDSMLTAAGVLQDVRSAVKAGTQLIQYREKKLIPPLCIKRPVR